MNQDERIAGQSDHARLAINRERIRLKQSLHEFVKKYWHVVEPARPFQDNWHIRVLCEDLEALFRGEVKREIINVPPGTMKSLLVSVFFPAWVWAKDPRKRFVCASYAASITIDQNRKVRELVNSDDYQMFFDVRFTEDQDTKIRFNTTKGGWRIATSVGGMLTGEHPDFIIIDDVITAEQATSAQERKAANDWFDSTVSTRGIARGVAIIVIAQRLHQEDLPGYLLARGGWLHRCFPMRYEPTRPKTVDDPQGHTADPLDPRRVAGELLWPALFDEAKVRQLELDLGPYGAAGQLQQRPVPEGGGLFKREWFKFVDAVPKEILRRARGWDTAGSEGKGDWTRGVKIEESGAHDFYVSSCVGGQLGPDGVDKLILSTAEMDGKDVAQREEKEGGASGKAVIAARAKLLRGWDYAGVQVSGNKVTRAKPFRSQVEGGHVYLVRGAWNEDYVKELCDFPSAVHDDQVDASSCAFNAILLEPIREVRVREAVWG